MMPGGATHTQTCTTGQKQRCSAASKMPRPHKSVPTPTPPSALPLFLTSWLVQGTAVFANVAAQKLLFAFFSLFFEKSCQRLTLLSPSPPPPPPHLLSPTPLPAPPCWGSPQVGDSLLMATWHSKPLLHLPVFEPRHSWNVSLILHSISGSLKLNYFYYFYFFGP